MKIIVTGGAGFIGSTVVDMLIEKNHEVVIIDNLCSGQKENINPKAKFLETDITDFAKIEEIFQMEKPETVYHFAAQIDVRKSVSDPLFDAQTNILAGLNLINLSQKYDVQKFIFSSTGGAIYGDTDQRPTIEDHSEWPLSPYGIAKLTTDKYLNYYNQIHGLKFVSLRYGNVYGTRQNPHGEAGVVAIFLNKMLNNDQPTINGDGEQTRDYVYVADVARANLAALENFEKVGVYNVGTGIETSVNQLFREINKNFANKFEELHGPAKMGEQKTSCLDASKIKNDLGWEPKVDFAEGIQKTFEWFKNRNSA